MAGVQVRPRADETARLLVEASFDILAARGWADFSLRAAAAALGAAGSAASHRFGGRTGLVQAIAEAALAREAEAFAAFLPEVTVGDADELALVLCAWFDRRGRLAAPQARAFSELLAAARREPALAGFGPRWAALAAAFLRRLSPRLGPEAQDLAAVLALETPFWTAMSDQPLFRLSAHEALWRAARLSLAPGAPLPVAWLRRGFALAGGSATTELSGAKQRIAEAAAATLREGGVAGVTHRVLARRSAASLSSLTHHYRSLEDLIRHGFERLFAADGAPEAGLETAAELALQALRDPALFPLAAAVRRRAPPGAEAAPDDVLARADVAARVRAGRVLAGL